MTAAFGWRRRAGWEPPSGEAPESTLSDEEMDDVDDDIDIDLTSSPSLSCPTGLPIEVSVQDAAGNALPGIDVRLLLGDLAVDQRTNDGGRTRFDALPDGSYSIVLPTIDKGTWNQFEIVELEGEKPAPVKQYPWAPPADYTAGVSVTVEEGECLASLGFEYGMCVEDIWTANEALHRRGEQDGSPFILAPGDEVQIPELTPRKPFPAKRRMRYVVMVRVPSVMLRLRLRTYALQARPDVDYELEIFDEDWEPLPVLEGEEGKSGKDGLIKAKVPVTARYGRLRLGPAPAKKEDRDEREAVSLRIGEIDPLDQESGFRGRLNDLAFYCGDGAPDDEEEDSALLAAARHFLRFVGPKDKGGGTVAEDDELVIKEKTPEKESPKEDDLDAIRADLIQEFGS